jgi:outer membrane protein OmpA-like peptidoglycan-associated protein
MSSYAPDTRSRRLALAGAAAVLALLAGCAAEPPPAAAPAPVVQPAPTPPAPPPPPEPVAFDVAVARAAGLLLSAAEKVPGVAPQPPRPVMIDPLIDGNTAQQTLASESMGKQIAAEIGAKHPQFAVAPFQRASLEKNPLLLIGTLTAIPGANPKAPNDLYRICLALIDVKAGKVIAKGVGRALGATVDATPTRYYEDSPTWAKDKVADGYIRSCQGTRAGDAADILYLETLPTSMAINDAIQAYNGKRFAEANRLYRTAMALPGGEQKRVVNGMYLTSWKMNKRTEATDAFGKIVVRGLEDKKLGIKFLFKPNTSDFVADADLRRQYALWLRVLAQRAVDKEACMAVVGHTSKTGTDPANEALSLKRAETIRARLERQSAKLKNMLQAQGAGSRETLVGSGTDDARDALDRRVEFKVQDCAAAPA